MLNLIELEHRQTTPKTLNQPGKQEEATGINGDSTRTIATRKKWRNLNNNPSTTKDTRCL